MRNSIGMATKTPFSRGVNIFLVALFGLMLCGVRLSSAAERKIGVVLMHGKWGSPDRNINELAASMKSKGFMVSTPVMPWSIHRGYDADYPAALEIVDRSVRELRNAGATLVVVAGHSMGANAAVAEAAYGHEPIDGVVAIAPGHAPEQPGYHQKIEESLKLAMEMVKAGRGDEPDQFLDINAGRSSTVAMTAAAYMSYNDPSGMGSMPVSAAKVKQPIPLLWIVAGPGDVLYRQGRGYVFERWPSHPKNSYLVIDSSHYKAPDDAIGDVVAWLRSL